MCVANLVYKELTIEKMDWSYNSQKIELFDISVSLKKHEQYK